MKASRKGAFLFSLSILKAFLPPKHQSRKFLQKIARYVTLPIFLRLIATKHIKEKL